LSLSIIAFIYNLYSIVQTERLFKLRNSMKKNVFVTLILLLSALTFVDAQSSCTTPPAPYVGTGTFCGCGQVVAKARRNPQIVGKTFVWYDNPNRTGNPLPSTTTLENDISLLSSINVGIPFNITTTTNKTVWAFEKEGDCYSTGSMVVLTVFPVPQSTPTLPINSVRACESATLTATPVLASHKIDWWTTSNQTPGTKVADGPSYTLINNTNSLISQTLFVYEYTEEACGSGDVLRCYGPPATANIFVFPKLLVDAGADVSICTGQTATLTAKATGGDNSAYAYTWKRGTANVGSTSILTGVSISGDYTVEVLDVNGCKATDIVKVTIGNSLTVNAGVDVDICSGSSTTLTAVVNGSGTYDYTWTKGTTVVGNTAAITVSVAGIYTVVASDKSANGCSATDNVEVKNSSSLPTPNVGSGAVCGCNQVIASVGQCSTCPTGTTISWYDNATGTGTPIQQGGNTFTSTTSRTLYVFYKSGTCLSASAKYVLTVLPVPNITPSVSGPNLVATIDGKEVSNCASVTVAAIPSITGNTLEWWSTPNQTPGTQLTTGTSYTSLISGIVYIHEVKTETCASGDVVKCYGAPLILKITVHPVPTVSLGADVSICGTSSTTLSASATGGVSPFKYSWSNAATTQSISVSAAGIYKVTVTDNKGCTGTDEVEVKTGGNNVSFTLTQEDIKCFGERTGKITVKVNGTGDFVYSINGTDFQSSAIFDNLSAKSYTISVQLKGSSCTSTQNITIKEPTALKITVVKTSITTTTSLGSIDITATGGTNPYSYSIENGDNWKLTSSFSSLKAGTYTVIVRDANGCLSEKQSIKIEQLDNITPIYFSTFEKHISCKGNTDGQIKIYKMGGGVGGPYQTSLDNGKTWNGTDLFENLEVGHYNVRLKDKGGNISPLKVVFINEPNAVTFNTWKFDVSCGHTANGVILVYAKGGNSGYEYSANGGKTFQKIGLFYNQAIGKYSIVVKDYKGCISAPVEVEIKNKCDFKPSGLERAIPSQFIPVVMHSTSPNPTMDILEVKLTSLDVRTQEFVFFNMTGQPMMREKRTLEKGEQTLQFDCFNLPSGMYQIITPGTISKTTDIRFLKL
jgi:SprB repeat